MANLARTADKRGGAATASTFVSSTSTMRRASVGESSARSTGVPSAPMPPVRDSVAAVTGPMPTCVMRSMRFVTGFLSCSSMTTSEISSSGSTSAATAPDDCSASAAAIGAAGGT